MNTKSNTAKYVIISRYLDWHEIAYSIEELNEILIREVVEDQQGNIDDYIVYEIKAELKMEIKHSLEIKEKNV